MRGQRQPVAVILINLGTPEAATPKAVRTFLGQFLSDPRVVEIPRILWLIILNLFVLPFRPKPVAEAYSIVWTERGSPLRWITEDQVKGLTDEFAKRYEGLAPTVCSAMTYGKPSIADTIDELYQSGHRRMVILPMYPQYSGSTTGAVYDQIARYIQRTRALPGLSIINAYFHKPEYTAALANSIHSFWAEHGRSEHLLFSYHGIPESYVAKGDPYTGHCECTTGGVVAALKLTDKDYTMTYQSRFGKAEWVKPYTDKTIEALAAKGVKSIDVICPAFAADCLETLEEIAEQNRDAFIEAGGEQLRLIPCLNASEPHIKALADILDPYIKAAQ